MSTKASKAARQAKANERQIQRLLRDGGWGTDADALVALALDCLWQRMIDHRAGVKRLAELETADETAMRMVPGPSWSRKLRPEREQFRAMAVAGIGRRFPAAKRSTWGTCAVARYVRGKAKPGDRAVVQGEARKMFRRVSKAEASRPRVVAKLAA